MAVRVSIIAFAVLLSLGLLYVFTRKPEPHYQITVWVVRPVAKYSPTWAQAEKDKRWRVMPDLQNAEPITEDVALLKRLRHDNPFYSFPEVREKYVKTVASEETWDVPLKTCKLQMTMRPNDREKVLSEMMRPARLGAKPISVTDTQRQRQFFSHWVLVEERGIIISLGSSRSRVAQEQMSFSGYRFVKPETVRTINSDVPSDKDSVDKQSFHSLPFDLVLFTIIPS